MEYLILFGGLALYFFYRVGLRDQQKKERTLGQSVGADAAASRARCPGPPAYRISYLDSQGAKTEREISPYKSGVNRHLLPAYCHLRSDRRDFAFSRVLSAVDLNTGEILSRHGFWLRFHPGKLPPGGIVE